MYKYRQVDEIERIKRIKPTKCPFNPHGSMPNVSFVSPRPQNSNHNSSRTLSLTRIQLYAKDKAILLPCKISKVEKCQSPWTNGEAFAARVAAKGGALIARRTHFREKDALSYSGSSDAFSAVVIFASSSSTTTSPSSRISPSSSLDESAVVPLREPDLDLFAAWP